MKPRLVFTFERGGEFWAEFLSQNAPETIRAVKASLPLDKTVFHTRWCGREINVPFKSLILPPKENQTSSAGFGDVIYWRDWDSARTRHEALAVYYGPEIIRDHRGFLLANVLARVPQDQWPIIEEVGLRVWQQGVEKVRIRVV
jgi:hypothetical protein